MMKIDPRKDPTRHCLKIAHWPEEDQRAWKAALEEGDIFEPGGVGAGWAPITQNAIAESYGRWLTWLTQNDLLTGAPGARVTAEHLIRYIDALKTFNAASTIVGRISGLYQAIHAMVPDRDWRWIKRFESKMRRSSRPGEAKRGRIVPADELLSYGQELMRDAEALARDSPVKLSAQYRDGLMIAFLAMRPLRLKNLAAMEIGRHLIARSTGYWLIYEAEETKTQAPIEIPFPKMLTGELERYLTHHRPILAERSTMKTKGLPPAGQAFWVSNIGTAMSQGAIYGLVTKRTLAKFGHEIHPHLFRDCAATSIATEDPAHVRITMNVLGHSEIATSEKHYSHARSIEATKRLQTVIGGLRNSGRDSRARAKTEVHEQ